MFAITDGALHTPLVSDRATMTMTLFLVRELAMTHPNTRLARQGAESGAGEFSPIASGVGQVIEQY